MFLEYLEPDVMFELSKTELGKRKVQHAAKMARITLSVHSVLGYMIELGVFNRPLTQEEQENIANCMAYCLYEAKHDVLLDFLRKIPSENSNDVGGNC